MYNSQDKVDTCLNVFKYGGQSCKEDENIKDDI